MKRTEKKKYVIKRQLKTYSLQWSAVIKKVANQ